MPSNEKEQSGVIQDAGSCRLTCGTGAGPCRVFPLLLALAIAAAIAVWRMSTSEVYAGAALPLLVAGEAHIPYQYRVLVPLLVRGAEGVGLGAPLAQLLAPLGLDRVAVALGAAPELASIFLAVEIVSLWALLVSFWALACRILRSSSAKVTALLVLVAALLVLPRLSQESRLWYPSDIPAIFVVVLAYLTLFSKRLAAFCLVFVLGTLNRETTIFLLPLVVLLPTAVTGARQPWMVISVLGAFWVALKAALFVAYRGNHGYPVHPNIVVNIEILSSWQVAVAAAAALMAIVFLGVHVVRKTHDERLKAALQAAALFFMVILFAGKIDEFRVYLELVPLAALVVAGVSDSAGPKQMPTQAHGAD